MNINHCRCRTCGRRLLRPPTCSDVSIKRRAAARPWEVLIFMPPQTPAETDALSTESLAVIIPEPFRRSVSTVPLAMTDKVKVIFLFLIGFNIAIFQRHFPETSSDMQTGEYLCGRERRGGFLGIYLSGLSKCSWLCPVTFILTRRRQCYFYSNSNVR